MVTVASQVAAGSVFFGSQDRNCQLYVSYHAIRRHSRHRGTVPVLGITRNKIAADSMQSWLSLFDCVLAALAVALPRICVVPWLGLVGHPQSKGLRLCASYVADTNCVNMKGDHAPKPRLHLIDSDIV